MKSANDYLFTCKKFRKNLRAYIDNELSGSIKAEFIAHSSQCPECGKALGDMEGTVRILAILQPATASKEFGFSLKTRILLERDRLDNPLYRFSLFLRERVRYLLAVPAFTMAVLIALFFYTKADNSFSPGNIFRDISTALDSQNVADTVSSEEINADEIVYVYYVLETVYSPNNDIGPAHDSGQTPSRFQAANNTFNTVSF